MVPVLKMCKYCRACSETVALGGPCPWCGRRDYVQAAWRVLDVMIVLAGVIAVASLAYLAWRF